MVEEPPMPAAIPGDTYVEPVSTPADRPQGTQAETVPPQTRQPVVEHTSVGAVGAGGGGSRVTSAPVAGPAPVARPPVQGTSRKILGLSLPILGAGIIGVICLLGIGIYGISRILTGGLGASPPTEEPVVPIVENTQAPTETVAPEPTTTLTAEPTEIPTETPIPASPTPDTPYVEITSIGLDGNTYVVDYEVHNFPDSPQLHVHMFFDTVPPEQAGAPGRGPWKLTYGQYGPSPFKQYSVSNRPAGATQMCSLVANPNHSVQLGTGNCVDLPAN